MARRISFKQQLLSRTGMEVDDPPGNPADPPGEGDTCILALPEDCLGLILDLLDPVTVATLEKTGRSMYKQIEVHQYWRRALQRLVSRQPYLADRVDLTCSAENPPPSNTFKLQYRSLAKQLNIFWKKNERFKPLTVRNNQYYCEAGSRQKVVSMRVTGSCFITVLGPRTRSDLAVFSIKVFDRRTREKINEISNLIDKPEYLVFSPRYNMLVAKAHETCPSMPDTVNIWALEAQIDPLLRAYHLKASGLGARCTALVMKEDIFFGSLKKNCVVMVPTRYNNKSVVRFLALTRAEFSSASFPSQQWKTDNAGDRFVKTNNGLIYEGNRVAVEEVGRVHVPHLVQLGVADFSDKWALLFSEAPKELPDRNISLIVIDMSTMAIKHILKAYEPRIAVYGASLHQQEPDVAVAVGKDGYLKVFDMDNGRELTNQRVPKPMARTNTTIIDFFGTTRFMLGSITDIHVFDLQFPLYPSPEAKMDRIERRREHIRTVSIYGEVWDMVEERQVQLAPPPGVHLLDPLMQLQQNLAALNQVNQAIEANIVRPELPEEADRVEQLMVEFRAVQQRIHDLNQEMEARISVAIEAVAADLRHIFVLTNTGDIMMFDFCQSSPLDESGMSIE